MKLQQGDVILKTAEIPAEAKKRTTRSYKGYVLAYGEQTGHSHVIKDGVEIYEHKGVLYVKAYRKTVLMHEEHDPMQIEPGTYMVSQVREFNPFTDSVRPVLD